MVNPGDWTGEKPGPRSRSGLVGGGSGRRWYGSGRGGPGQRHPTVVVLDLGPGLTRPFETFVQRPPDLLRGGTDRVEFVAVCRQVVPAAAQEVGQPAAQERREPAAR